MSDQGLNVAVSDAELALVLERRTLHTHAMDSPKWAELVSVEKKRYAKRRIKQALLGGLTSKYKRSQEKVREFYEEGWDENSAVHQVRQTSVDLFEWRSTGYEAHYPTTPALHNYLVSRSLAATQPETVLEVGCGSGLQLFTLASRHPDIRFFGGELTEAGVREAHKLQAIDELPPELVEFGFDPVLDPQAHKRIEFRQASAAELPYEANSIDVVYTTIALEQMEEIRDAALTNLARVAARYVVMVEPFRDFNLEGIRHDYVRSRDIFGAYVEDLPRYGLKPVFTYSDFPWKVSLGVGLVIAAVD